jgi:hypothetical protein
MEKRMKNYLSYIDEIIQSDLSAKEKSVLKAAMLTQIMFFQHERLIHLLVTLTFALATVICLASVVLTQSIIIAMFLLFLVCLLVPYIRHYFILENGVQKLYEYYDRLEKPDTGENHEQR